jgi:hypothetical protein
MSECSEARKAAIYQSSHLSTSTSIDSFLKGTVLFHQSPQIAFWKKPIYQSPFPPAVSSSSSCQYGDFRLCCLSPPTCLLQLLSILWLTEGTTITPPVSFNCCWSPDSLKVPQSPHLSPPTAADPLTHWRYHNQPSCLFQLLLILLLTEGTTLRLNPPVSTNCCWSFAAECSGPQPETLGFVSGQRQHPILSLHLLHTNSVSLVFYTKTNFFQQHFYHK